MRHQENGPPRRGDLQSPRTSYRSVTLVLGDNVFCGHGFPALLANACGREAGATIFACRVNDPQRYGVVEFNADQKAVSMIEHRQGVKVACLEEIAFSKSWIGRDDVKRAADALAKTSYGQYLHQLLADGRQQ